MNVVHPTAMQEAAAEKFVELQGKSVSRAMRESKIPFSPKTAKNPKNLTERKGFQIAIRKYGLNEGLVRKALVADIKKKPQKRVSELNLAADILGMKKQTDIGNKTLIVVIAGESATRYGVRTS